MCGLAGVAGDCDSRSVSVFNELMWAMALRGRDASGVAAIARDGEVDVLKTGNDITWLQYDKRYDKTIGGNKLALIGHCRHATMGSTRACNAHPFEFEKVVGAHNGTVPWSAKNDLPGGKAFDTDSEAIYHSINEIGLKDTISQLQGAWALTWFDKEGGTINFLRNKERPLTYAFTKDKKRLFWCSEPGALKWVLSRNGFNELDGDTIYGVTEDTHVSWQVPKSWSESFPERQLEKISGFQFVAPPVVAGVPVGAYQGNRGASSRSSDTSPRHFSTQAETLFQMRARRALESMDKPKRIGPSSPWPSQQQPQSSPGTSNVVPFKGAAPNPIKKPGKGRKGNNKHITYKDHRGNFINKKEFELIAKHGCAMCQKDIEWQDECKFTKDDDILCGDCMNNPDVLSFGFS